MSKISGVHVPAKVKNIIINGNMDFWQRVEAGTTTVNTATSTQNFTADRMKSFSSGTTSKNYSIVQSATVPTFAQSGFDSQASYQFTVGTGISSYAANDLIWPLYYIVEGYDYQRIHGKTVTFGFWFQASVPGTYSFSLSNSSLTRSYVTTFNITAANTWQYVTITVALDNTGTWLFTNGQGLLAFIAATGGSTATTSTLNSWQTVTGASNVTVASTATNFYGTTGATFNVAQFSMIEGSNGLGPTGFLRTGENISEELRMCQRYYEKSYDIGIALGTNAAESSLTSGIAVSSTVLEIPGRVFKVTKRISPTVSIYAYAGTINALSATQNSSTLATGVAALRAGPTSILDITASGMTAGSQYWFNWTAESEL